MKIWLNFITRPLQMTLFANLVIPSNALASPSTVAVLEECRLSRCVILLDTEGGRWIANAHQALQPMRGVPEQINHMYARELITALKNRGRIVKLSCEEAVNPPEQLRLKNIVAPAIVSFSEGGTLLVNDQSFLEWRTVVADQYGFSACDNSSEFINGPLGTLLLPPSGSHLIYADRYVVFRRGLKGKNYVVTFQELFDRWIALNGGQLVFDVVRVSDEGDCFAAAEKFFSERAQGLRKGQTLQVRVFQVDHARVHKRLLLNRSSGINFDFGFEENPQGKQEVEVISQAVWESRFKQYGGLTDGEAQFKKIFVGGG